MDASYAVVSEPLTSVETPRDVSTDISVDLKSQNAALQSRILELEANVQVQSVMSRITPRKLSFG